MKVMAAVGGGSCGGLFCFWMRNAKSGTITAHRHGMAIEIAGGNVHRALRFLRRPDAEPLNLSP